MEVEGGDSQRVLRLTANLPWMRPELKAAVEYASTDPSASLAKSRLVLEKMLRRVLELEDDTRSG